VFAKATRVVEQTYEWPFQSHAGMAPACGVADVHNGEATIWSGTQKPHYAAQGVAKMLNMPLDKVKCVSMTGPGSYGRNDAGDATMDAAVLSQAVGKPVRVQGMRHEGHGWDPKAPASVHVARAALDQDGKVIAWQFETKGFSKRDLFTNEGDPAHTLAGQLLGMPLKHTAIFGAPSARPRKRSRRCSIAARRCAPRTCATRAGHRRRSRSSRSWMSLRSRPIPIRSSSACAT
jgi:hypothetical protein